jgi:hypothetical protein
VPTTQEGSVQVEKQGGSEKGYEGVKTYLCVVDLLPSGRIAALEVEATDAITAERDAQEAGRERFGGQIEVIEVIRTDRAPAA